MDRTLHAVRKILQALDAPAYDIGILSDRGMLPGLAALTGEQVLSRLSLLKSHNVRGAHVYIRPSGEHRFTVLDDLNESSIDRLVADELEPCAIAQTLAKRYQGDPSAADWRRFGRLPGFTNCKQKYRRPDGLFPFVLLRSATGQPCSRAAFLRLEMTQQFQLREQERARRIAQFRSDLGGRRSSHLSLKRFRLSPRYAGRPASADIAFSVAAYSLAMPEHDIANALADDYLSRDPNPRRKAAYIERTLAKARAWAQR